MNQLKHSTEASHSVLLYNPTSEEQKILDRVERYLEDALALKRWWEDGDARGRSLQRFELERTYNRPAWSYGFFGTACVRGATMPVMGNVQKMFFDQPKLSVHEAGESGLWMQKQLREFTLRYFMRVSSFRQPEAFVPEAQSRGDVLLHNLSWCTQSRIHREGFGFQQLYYRTLSGEIGRFDDPLAIVDMREIGTKYEWIVLKVKIFNFSFKVRPFHDSESGLVFGLDEESYLVVHRLFILDEEQPAPGILGRYAIGYGFIKSPRRGLLAYGPGEFDAAFEQIEFSAAEDGRIGVHMVFVVNRPSRIANLNLNPLEWSLRFAELATLGAASPVLGPLRQAVAPFSMGNIDPVFTYIRLMNAFTAGQSADLFCISKEQLERTFLLQHFMQHYETAAGSLFTWRQVRDWLDEASIPQWVKTGRSS